MSWGGGGGNRLKNRPQNKISKKTDQKRKTTPNNRTKIVFENTHKKRLQKPENELHRKPEVNVRRFRTNVAYIL